ncbi:MAG: CDP-alcohol phosphatidyltransferase family protein [Bacteroidales bacterium]|nr:CDP-alcohol phosphatidyltransferase family protein [Bacteroidales bacterium]
MLKKEIPNILTLCNLLCGCASVVCTFSSNLYWASWFIGIAAVFDLFDGMVARMLRVSGTLGAQLDSLADVVSFGVAPAAIAYNMLRSQLLMPNAVCFIVFIMAAASAYRLARFNTDPAQKGAFFGMPTPANALFWAALNLYWFREGVVLNAWYLLALALLMSFLLVCRLRMFSFKGKDWSWKAKRFVYIYALVSVVLLFVFGSLGLAVDVLLYPCFSILHFRLSENPVNHEIQG